MSKLTLVDLASLTNETSAISTINANNATLEERFDNTLSRDGSTPNEMEANLDMNGFRILNLPDAVAPQEPATLSQVQDTVDNFVAERVFFSSIADATDADIPAAATDVFIGQKLVNYKLRTSEPTHPGFKFQDGSNRWWSPDWYILVAQGESNAIGNPNATDGDFTTNENVYAWYPDTSELKVADPTDQVAPWRVTTNPVNNMYFHAAKKVCELQERPVALVLYGVPGTFAWQWIQDSAIDQSLINSNAAGASWTWTGVHYVTSKGYVEAVLTLLDRDTVDACCITQGINGDDSVGYSDNRIIYQAWIDQLRAESWVTDKTPILFTEHINSVGTTSGAVYRTNWTFRDLASGSDPYIGLVHAGDLEDVGDSVHFTGTSLQIMGENIGAKLQVVPFIADSAVGAVERMAYADLYPIGNSTTTSESAPYVLYDGSDNTLVRVTRTSSDAYLEFDPENWKNNQSIRIVNNGTKVTWMRSQAYTTTTATGDGSTKSFTVPDDASYNVYVGNLLSPAATLTSATGDGSTTAYTIPSSNTYNAVYVNGTLKTITTDYTIAGTTLTFLSAPTNGHAIKIYTSNTINAHYQWDSTTTRFINAPASGAAIVIRSSDNANTLANPHSSQNDQYSPVEGYVPLFPGETVRYLRGTPGGGIYEWRLVEFMGGPDQVYAVGVPSGTSSGSPYVVPVQRRKSMVVRSLQASPYVEINADNYPVVGEITFINDGSGDMTIQRPTNSTQLFWNSGTNTWDTSYALTAGQAVTFTKVNNGDSISRLRAISSSAASTTPGGADTYVQFNDGGVFGGVAGFTFDSTKKTLSLASASQTTNTPVFAMSQTWNNSGVSFHGLRLNITDTNSASTAKFVDFQVSSVSKFSVRKDGQITASDYNGPLTSATGLPLSTGITGFGSGVATFLATPSSANLAAALTDETGTGSVVFNTNPSLSGTLTLDSDVKLLRTGSNTLAMRNSTTGQKFEVFVTYTDASNYTKLYIDGANYEFGATGAGTGINPAMSVTSQGHLIMQAGSGGSIFNKIGGTTRWVVDNGFYTPSTGDWVPGANNSYSIGYNGQTVKNIFITGNMNDTNGNELLGWGATASAVNYVKITNSATGNAAKVEAVGDDTNVSLNLASKGTGQVTHNTYQVPIMVASSGAAASHTGNTTRTAKFSCTIPANSMGPNGWIRVTFGHSHTSSANAKTVDIKLGGTTFLNLSGFTSTTSARYQYMIFNRNATNSQVGASATQAGGGWGTNTAAVATGAEDTTASKTLEIGVTLANSGETITIEYATVEVCYGT